jgi:hypothetical protein
VKHPIRQKSEKHPPYFFINVKHDRRRETPLIGEMISWIICETIVTYFLIDTEQSETPPIHLNKCEPNETCIIH